jgi:hypothetical protein
LFGRGGDTPSIVTLSQEAEDLGFEAFGMVVVVEIISLVVSVIISFITSPLTLPFMGNLIGSFINASFTFYFYLVVACILGLSLFKCADRLGIAVD